MEYVKVGAREDAIVLQDENGARAAFEFVEMARVGGKEYAALLQLGEEELVLLRMLEDGSRERYAEIEDDAEFESVRLAFERIFEEE